MWFGDRGYAPEPEPQRLPVDAQDDAEGEQRYSAEGAQERTGAQRLHRTGNRSVQEVTTGTGVLDSRQSAATAGVEAKRVIAGDRHERRNMEDLAAVDGLSVTDRWAIGVRQEIQLTFSEGVVGLGEDGDQFFVAIVAEPETDRVEDIAENARKALQPDLAVGGDPPAPQQTHSCREPDCRRRRQWS